MASYAWKTIYSRTIYLGITISAIIFSLLVLYQIPQRVFTQGPELVTIILESDHRWANPSQALPGLEGGPARKLIESIKEARRRASGTFDNQPSDDIGKESEKIELEEWTRQNPCVSRLELMPMYNKRKHAKQLPPNPLWEELLVEYSKLHRTCIKRVGNLTDYFLTGNVTVPGCQFAVADIAPFTGLGNKFLVTVSALLYAIVTQRVVLIPSATLQPDYLCEPFIGSSWVLDSGAFPVPHFSNDDDFKTSLWTRNTAFFTEIDQALQKMDHTLKDNFGKGFIVPVARLENAVGVVNYEWQIDNRFYCSAEQTFYSQSTWVYMSGCIYTVPKLYGTPLFRPILEEIFPDKMVSTRLLRSLLLPADVVWGRIRRINHAYLADADRRVGIQVRYKDGIGHYNRMNALVNERIMSCSRNFALLPEVNSSSVRDPTLSPEDASSPKPMVKVFLASLFPGLYDLLSENFARYPSLTGEEVALVQVSQDRTQKMDDVEEDRQALTEVLLLSFSDQLIVTPMSTFGGLAQAYGALTPWFVEMREDRNIPPCERGQTVDVCNQFSDKAYKCPHDPKVNMKRFSDVVPYIRDCLTIDHDQGIQLITAFHS